VGWSVARVYLTRRLQRFKCLETGHVRRDCTSATDRCYQCSESGHRVRECPARVPRCPICTDLGLPASHRMGIPSDWPSRDHE
jgi:hypothetical protein